MYMTKPKYKGISIKEILVFNPKQTPHHYYFPSNTLNKEGPGTLPWYTPKQSLAIYFSLSY